jgi:hypothetical protein
MSSNNDCSGTLFLWLIAIGLWYYIIILNSEAEAFSLKIKIDGKSVQKIQVILQRDKNKDYCKGWPK